MGVKTGQKIFRISDADSYSLFTTYLIIKILDIQLRQNMKDIEKVKQVIDGK
ncbi:hypothetical protein HNQ88_003942 [Aureibacter tunicatorum]|uniref:Uncharacterized protein n=1 Tax=Aureibacter tunicatorum TaxID=866807 RepID=A0AAE4BTN2_9BACT|nr:hypothetical protein [Aureibacter tunicatorum]BDD06800.1 hypothetical protein AUTU_42830 [Aureibacter tunicatorum]